MNIGIIDADLIGRKSHRFPNLACTKLSAYNKQIGNNVTLVTDYGDLFSKYIDLLDNELPEFNYILFGEADNKKFTRYYKEEDIIYDKIIISKVFTDTEVPMQIKDLPICEYGGTGFFYDKAEPLPYEIEHHFPDYHLYDDWVTEQLKQGKDRKEFEYYLDYSIGFTTRGCFRKCPFCVNKKYDKVSEHSPIHEFLDISRKYICLLDDNILGYSDWKSIINQLKLTGKYFQYKQGMDERLMSNEKAEILSKCKYKGDYIFAFDNIEDAELIKNKLKIWKTYCKKTTKLYVLCGFDKNEKYDETFWKQDVIDTFERIKILMEHGCLPYIMRYNKYEESPYRGTYINLARWCNQPNFFKKKSYREYCQANQDRTKNGDCSAIRYLKELEKEYPNIANTYFDIKYEQLNKYISNNKNINELPNIS